MTDRSPSPLHAAVANWNRSSAKVSGALHDAIAEALAEMDSEVIHRDGVPWTDAPRPRRWHRCEPQSTMVKESGRFERCACGGRRIDGGQWDHRNERRR